MKTRVEDYYTAPVVVISPNDTLAHARNTLLRHSISRLLVVSDRKLVGVITDTDFLKVLATPELASKPWDKIMVKEVMTPNPISIEVKSSIFDAAKLMIKYGIGTLPVLDSESNVIGILTRTDLVRAYSENFKDITKVAEVMDPDPPTVSLYHPITYVIDKIEERPYYKVIVEDGNRPVGIIAKRDLIFIETAQLFKKEKYTKRDEFLEKGRTGGVRYYHIPLAYEMMTPNPLLSHPFEDVAVAGERMISNKIGSLPVVDGDEGRLVGLIAKLHIVELLAQKLR